MYERKEAGVYHYALVSWLVVWKFLWPRDDNFVLYSRSDGGHRKSVLPWTTLTTSIFSNSHIQLEVHVHRDDIWTPCFTFVSALVTATELPDPLRWWPQWFVAVVEIEHDFQRDLGWPSMPNTPSPTSLSSACCCHGSLATSSPSPLFPSTPSPTHPVVP